MNPTDQILAEAADALIGDRTPTLQEYLEARRSARTVLEAVGPLVADVTLYDLFAETISAHSSPHAPKPPASWAEVAAIIDWYRKERT